MTNNKDNFYEQHLTDFYTYITNNERQIKYEVKKNITYEEELFDEAYADTIVKVANAIMVNHKVVDDFRFYFFISFKQNYIQLQNKKRRMSEQNVYGLFDTGTFDVSEDDNYEEERFERINQLYYFIAERLENFFPLNEVDIYIIYYRLKAGKNRVSYEKLAEIMDVDLKYITRTIQTIKKFVKEDEEILNKKKELLG